MGLVIIGMGINLLFVISLCVFFILYVLISSKKIGFLKTLKSWTAIVTIVLIFVCGVLPLLSFIPRSGNRLFKDYILNPMPKTIKVIDSYDGSPEFYPDTCLHFKSSPDDFQRILASKKWEVVSDDRFAGLTCTESTKNPWDFTIPPPSLGSNVITYTFVPNERDYEVMFTNTQMNEVYYYYYDGYMP
jgi:hypothetical protein